MRARVWIAAVALAGAMAAPAAAQMNVAVKVFQDFAADGLIDPCKHSSEDLRKVQKNIPPDIEQYAPDYPAAVAGALEARARGDCAGEKPEEAAPIATSTPAATPTPAPTPAATSVPTETVVPDPPEPEKPQIEAVTTAQATKPDAALERAATARPANDAPVPVLLLAVLAALLLLATIAVLAARRAGPEGRLAPVRHSVAEASWRAGAVWQDFRDWLRLGR